jgi:hypothetical protein
MATPEDATRTQLANIERATGRSVDDWADVVRGSGLERHGEVVAHLTAVHGLTHGNANALAHAVRSRSSDAVSAEDLLEAQLGGPRAALRPTVDELLAVARGLGDDVVVAVQKTGVSLRRGRQFALVQVPSARRVRLGLNLRGVPGTERLRPASGMCTHAVDVSDADDVDDELVGWLRAAYDRAT